MKTKFKLMVVLAAIVVLMCTIAATVSPALPAASTGGYRVVFMYHASAPATGAYGIHYVYFSNGYPTALKLENAYPVGADYRSFLTSKNLIDQAVKYPALRYDLDSGQFTNTIRIEGN